MQHEVLFEQVDVNHYMVEQGSLSLVGPGDLVTAEPGYMNGHGTYRIGDCIFSAVLGTVETTSKLVMVNPLRSRYCPQIGDIVVGVITEISNKRWKVDIKASAYAYLSLSSTYIPEQRKKNEEDEFNMRKVMQECDMIVAEVHSLNQDGTFNLHTRNPKYGKLQPGLFVEVSHRLVKRQKHHIVGIGSLGVLLGNNGNIYLSNFRRNEGNLEATQSQTSAAKYTAEELESLARLRNILHVLNFQGLQISESLLRELLQFVSTQKISTRNILQSCGPFKSELLERIRLRIPKRIDEISRKLKTRNNDP